MEHKTECLKGKPMSKQDVKYLLQFIESRPIITTKATNATNNKLKDEAWQGISCEFAAIVGETRRPEQLRLKWENLKKQARKRAAAIRQNNLKTGGGKGYIPPDDNLDHLAAILGATCSGLTVEFGGDAADIPEVVSSQLSQPSLPMTETDSLASTSAQAADGCSDPGDTAGGSEVVLEEVEYTPRAVLFNHPRNGQNKRRKLAEDLLKAEIDKETALAEYFRSKTNKINVETEILKKKL